ncbi:MAG: radical SAM protein [Candidatus Marinimicrobia bacterium]|nr:radical SAM protein [Candidatus Neomarinimicrobiota bacterium]
MFPVEQVDFLENPRKRRNYIYLEHTQSLCSKCLRVIDAKIIRTDDNQIVLRKWCREHGFESCLLHSDADWYIHAQKYNRPGDIPLKFPTQVERGCPYDCGVCPDHEQHMCLGLIDLTDACNLACPTCFADSKGTSYLSMDQIKAALDGFIEQEGVGAVVQFSGGEPTMHPDVIEAVKQAVERPTEVVMINTNGIKMAQDEDFVKRLVDASDYKLEIYLQFDGFTDEVNKAIRGAKMADMKMKAIENMLKHGLPINLAAVIQRGINEDQIGKIVEFGIKTKGIRGVNFQPAFAAGRFDHIMNPMDRVTNTEIMQALETQTDGMFRKTDFLPLPCSHPSQIALTYAYIKGKKVKPIPRFVNLDPYMDQFINTIYTDPRPIYKKAIEGLWSASSSFNSMKTLYDFSCVCGIPVKKDFYTTSGRQKIADENAFRIILIQFQDRFNWDMKVVKKCCIGFAMPDGRTIPFDAYNVLYRETHDVKHWQNGNIPSKIPMPAPYGMVPTNGNGIAKPLNGANGELKKEKKKKAPENKSVSK